MHHSRLVDQFSALTVIMLPGIFFWELSLGAYRVVRGFRPAPLTAGLLGHGERRAATAPAAVDAPPAAAVSG